MQKNRISSAGFTLLELMITIAVIAIIAVIAVPSFMGYVDGSQLRASAQEIFGYFQKAKMEAIKQNYPVAIIFDFSGNGSYQIFVDKDDDKVLDAGEQIIGEVTMPDKVKLQNSTFPLAGGTKTGFTTRGVPSGGQGSVELAKPDGSKIVTLTTRLAGSVTLN